MVKKTFNITDTEVLEFLKTKGNQSNYVTTLIKEDMKKSPSTGLTRTEVSKIVYEILAQYNFKKVNNINKVLSDKTKTAILDALGK